MDDIDGRMKAQESVHETLLGAAEKPMAPLGAELEARLSALDACPAPANSVPLDVTMAAIAQLETELRELQSYVAHLPAAATTEALGARLAALEKVERPKRHPSPAPQPAGSFPPRHDKDRLATLEKEVAALKPAVAHQTAERTLARDAFVKRELARLTSCNQILQTKMEELSARTTAQREDLVMILVQFEDLAEAFGSAQERLLRLRGPESPVLRGPQSPVTPSTPRDVPVTPLQEVLAKLHDQITTSTGALRDKVP